MKKRIIAVVLAAACVLTAVGCGKKEAPVSNKYVEVPKYKGIEVEKAESEEPKEEDVTSYIDSVLAQNRAEITDRALQEGDLAEFEYTGKLGDEVFDEGTLTLGNNESYVPGFAEGIYGHKLNETFELPITFPEGYGEPQKPELSGADVIFTIKITSIKESKLPELNDEFVKKVSEKSKTVEEYKKEVKAIIQKSNDNVAKNAMTDSAWNAVLEQVKVKEYPKERMDVLVKRMDAQIQKMLPYYGITYEEYVAQSGMTEEELKATMEDSAKEYLKEMLAAEFIAEQEGIRFSDDEYRKLAKEYAGEYGFKSADEMIEQVGEEEVKEFILQDKVKEAVVKYCKQVEPKEEKTEK